METYCVKNTDRKINAAVSVPGSKSVTNRALLMAALSDGKTTLNGVLFSDDSRHFLDCLISLGFDVDINEEKKIVSVVGCNGEIPQKTARIDVGSAGTAARFITAMLALSEGEYVINCSEQMKARPMDSLFDSLTKLGAEFEYLEEEGHLPAKVMGRGKKCAGEKCVTQVDISKSTQFLSALMMAGCMIKEGLDIVITSEKTTGSYVLITSSMMRDFGCMVEYDGHDYHIAKNQSYKSGEYDIEPDISAACYFWGMAAVTGGSVKVNGVKKNMMQGDMKFLDVLRKMGCEVSEETDGVRVSAPENGKLLGVDVNMNDFSDQTMTLAAIAPFAEGTTRIRNIGHIRLQESDRIEGILENLNTIGADAGLLRSSEDGKICEGIYINGKSTLRGGRIKTYNDHRMAMAFALCGLKVPGVVIADPMCCRKTFENYFEVFDALVQ